MEKEALDWMGELAIIHTTGKETENKYCVVELYATKEGSPPWHVHHNEDEGFYVIEGEMTIYVGDKIHNLKSGEFVSAPKNIPHMYTVDSPGHTRVLIICSPAGFENCVREMSTPATSLVPLTPKSTEIDYSKIMDIAAQYGIEFIDPPM